MCFKNKPHVGTHVMKNVSTDDTVFFHITPSMYYL